MCLFYFGARVVERAPLPLSSSKPNQSFQSKKEGEIKIGQLCLFFCARIVERPLLFLPSSKPVISKLERESKDKTAKRVCFVARSYRRTSTAPPVVQQTKFFNTGKSKDRMCVLSQALPNRHLVVTPNTCKFERIRWFPQFFQGFLIL